MNSDYQTVATVTGGNGLQADLHDFQIAPHDVAYITAYNPIRCDLASVGGPRNGAILDTAVQADRHARPGSCAGNGTASTTSASRESETSRRPRARGTGFTSTRSIPQPDGDLLISARNTWASYQLQGGTGTILWRLGGLKSSFTMGPGTKTAWQHDAPHAVRRRHHALRRRLGPAAMSRSRVRCGSRSTSRPTGRAWSPPARTRPRRCSPRARATCRRSRTGTAVVGYGGVPEISEYAKDRLAALRRPPAVRDDLLPGLPLPLERTPVEPRRRLAASLNNVGETIVHMSWNGATAVASWRVLAGETSGIARRRRRRSRRPASKARRPCSKPTPTWRCRRSTRPATCSGPRAREPVKSYATSVPGGRR